MAGTKLNGRWSLKYAECILCGATKAKHHGRGVCNTCYTKVLKKRSPKYREDSNNRTRAWNKKIRFLVLSHYSTNTPVCACCGEGTLEFLCIDHTNNNGSEDRKITKGSGSKTYVWLYKHGYPPGYQVLCHNCNMAKGFYGKCPHQYADKNT